MANDRSKFFFNVLALENILVALTREIGDGPCFLYIKFSWIGVTNQSKYKELTIRLYQKNFVYSITCMFIFPRKKGEDRKGTLLSGVLDMILTKKCT